MKRCTLEQTRVRADHLVQDSTCKRSVQVKGRRFIPLKSEQTKSLTLLARASFSLISSLTSCAWSLAQLQRLQEVGSSHYFISKFTIRLPAYTVELFFCLQQRLTTIATVITVIRMQRTQGRMIARPKNIKISPVISGEDVV